MHMKSLFVAIALLTPASVQAADITGTAKVREGNVAQVGASRIRLGGIDAPSVDQLCLNNKGERWTCGIAARDALIKHADNKTWTCHIRQAVDRQPSGRGRSVARCEVDGEDIQKWMVRNGWALSYVRFSHDFDEVLPKLDVCYMLRVQRERQRQQFFPSVREYSRLYGLSRRRVEALPDGAVIMHPGPMNRGVEIASDVADLPRAVITDQVTNGIAVRMSLLYLMLGGDRRGAEDEEPSGA